MTEGSPATGSIPINQPGLIDHPSFEGSMTEGSPGAGSIPINPAGQCNSIPKSTFRTER